MDEFDSPFSKRLIISNFRPNVMFLRFLRFVIIVFGFIGVFDADVDVVVDCVADNDDDDDEFCFCNLDIDDDSLVVVDVRCE